jgi:dihydroorotate dehydrogenase
MAMFSAAMKISPLRWAFSRSLRIEDARLCVRCFGIDFPNPIGLSAGFDKDARWLNELDALGFGFIEVGTLTSQPQPGNPKPRVFRLATDNALVNRIGFDNQGAATAAARLARGPIRPVLGINIGRTKVIPNEEAVGDYIESFNLLYPFASYITVNISSPNTPGLRALQESKPLVALLGALAGRGQELAEAAGTPPKPILVKIAPDLSEGQVEQVVEIVRQTGIAGIIATNTTTARDGLVTPAERIDQIGYGGLSGAPLTARCRRIVAELYRLTRGEIPIVGVGGIMSGEDAWQMFRAGAALVQVYTGLIYGGPGFIASINRHLLARLAESGKGSISDIVGEAAEEMVAL